MVRITIKQDGERWQLWQFKDVGLNKGDTKLAEFCGGNMGKTLCIWAARQAASMTFADEVHLEMEGELRSIHPAAFINGSVGA